MPISTQSYIYKMLEEHKADDATILEESISPIIRPFGVLLAFQCIGIGDRFGFVVAMPVETIGPVWNF
jgi:hypothetical protein